MPPRKKSLVSEQNDRLKRIEDALITLNHATEEFTVWKAEVSTDLKWLKYLVGVGAAAGAFTAVGEAIKLLK